MSHYYDQKQDGVLKEEEISFTLGVRFSMKTVSGTFSVKKLDKGTKTLIQFADIKENLSVLDLGCGWGAVGIVLKKLNPSITCMMSDINERAVLCAKENALKNNVSVSILQSDLFENITDSFDTILTNPPYAAGRAVCYKFIEESYNHLHENGSLQLVARHQKGGAMLEKKMKEIFGNVETLAKKGGFRVYKSLKLDK